MSCKENTNKKKTYKKWRNKTDLMLLCCISNECQIGFDQFLFKSEYVIVERVLAEERECASEKQMLGMVTKGRAEAANEIEELSHVRL